MEKEVPRFRVLVADGAGRQMDHVVDTVAGLGHEVILHHGLADVGPVTTRQKPDVAIVVVVESSDESLAIIDRIVREAACPVIALIDVQDGGFILEAAKRGIFAYLTGHEDPQELQSSIDIVLRRFAEYHNLEGAFGRRALTERAKGILMERHSIDEHAAFEMLRKEARRSNRRIVDVAEAMLASRSLLPGAPHPTVASEEGGPSPQ